MVTKENKKHKNNLVVAIKVNGKVLREFDDIVALPFGSTYEIFLKNLSPERCEIHISIDGKSISNDAKMIINGKSEITLKRYIDNDDMSIGNSFKFIEKTKFIEKHRNTRAEDGLITITFSHELNIPKQQLPDNIPFNPYWHEPYKSTPWWDSVPTCPNDWNTIWCSTSQDSYPVKTYSNVNNAVTISNVMDGITVPGEIVHQNFEHAMPIFSRTLETTLTLKLIGKIDDDTIDEPIQAMRKVKCKICKTNIKQTDKFCRECGASTNIISSEYFTHS